MNHPIFKSFLAVGAVALALNLSGCGSTTADSFAGSGGNNNPVPVVVASKSIGAGGGTLVVTDPTSPLVGSSIVIPPGALANPTTITISDAPAGGGFPAGTVPVNFGPSGTQFTLPVTVTLRYTQAYLNANGIVDPTTLKIVSSDPGIANETLKTLSQDTANFSLCFIQINQSADASKTVLVSHDGDDFIFQCACYKIYFLILLVYPIKFFFRDN